MRTLFKALGKIGLAACVAIAFVMGLASTVYLSLRSPEVKVPAIVGKNRWEGESTLEDAGLNIRPRATRYNAEAKPDTILDQWPRPGEIVKAGQTVAVVVSRATAKEGERASSVVERDAGGEKDEAPEKTESSSTAATKNSVAEKRNKAKNVNTKNANTKNTNRNANANDNSGKVIAVRPGNSNRNTNVNRNTNNASKALNKNSNANAARRLSGSNTNARGQAPPPF